MGKLTFDGERKLWASVIINAIIDAGKDVERLKTKHKEPHYLERDRARDFLLTNLKDFKMVCDMAGFDADALRTALKNELNNPERVLHMLKNTDSASRHFNGDNWHDGEEHASHVSKFKPSVTRSIICDLSYDKFYVC